MDGTALVRAVFRVLRAAVRCDFVNVCLRNVRGREGNRSYRMLDSRGREFGPEFLTDVFFQEHPGMPMLMANPGVRFINTRDVLGPEEVLRGTRFYTEVMQTLGFRHAVGVFFWDEPPRTPEAIFSLCRAQGEEDFGQDELEVLDWLHPQIAAAIARVRAAEDERALRLGLRGLAAKSGRAVCFLDWDLRLAGATGSAKELCALWPAGSLHVQGHKLPPFKLPGPVRQACVELKEGWHASLNHRPATGAGGRRTIHHPTRPGLRATVALHPAPFTPTGRPAFLVEFEGNGLASPAVPAKRTEAGSPLSLLSRREAEIARLVADGKSNQEIALQTNLALGSVKNSLHAIFQKLHVQNRTVLTLLLRFPPR